MTRNATIQYGAVEFSNPLSGTPLLPPPNPIITSDSFSVVGSGRLDPGEMTDAALGGQPMAWSTNALPARRPIKEDGQAKFKTFAGGSFIDIGEHTDVEAAMTITQMPTVTANNSPAVLNVRAASDAPAQDNHAYRLGVFGAGRLRLEKRYHFNGNNGTSTIQTAPIDQLPVVAGDRVKIRCVGSNIKLFVNDVLRIDVTDTDIPSGRFVGLSASDLAGDWAADDFVVRLIDMPELL